MQALARQIVMRDRTRRMDFVSDVAGEMRPMSSPTDGIPLVAAATLKLTEIIHSAPESLPPGRRSAA